MHRMRTFAIILCNKVQVKLNVIELIDAMFNVNLYYYGRNYYGSMANSEDFSMRFQKAYFCIYNIYKCMLQNNIISELLIVIYIYVL